MLKILGDLSPDDNFGLITFDSNIDVWKHELLQASQRNLEQAKDFVKKIEDRGGRAAMRHTGSYMKVTSLALLDVLRPGQRGSSPMWVGLRDLLSWGW